MKEIIYNKPNSLCIKENTLEFTNDNQIKVKITNALLTYDDIQLLQKGNMQDGIIPLTNAVSVVSDTQSNQELSRGERVYIQPFISCKECFECKTDNQKKCHNHKIMGKDIDGFLCDFKITDKQNIVSLPDIVDDESALYINHISSCIGIINKLDVQKGQYFAIFGSDIYSNILCQLCLYYQAIPILIDSNKYNINIAKKHGVYYCIENESEIAMTVKQITGGRMVDNAVYFASSSIPTKYIAEVCGFGATIAYFGELETQGFLSYKMAVKKQLQAKFISGTFQNVHSAINILANKAINVSDFLQESIKFDDSIQKIEQLKKEDIQKVKISDIKIEI